ncbi:hypothetical protein B0H63DRAFT_517190 [Podospora didyma]|uniref:Anaphase-promoting complex subunit 2 n=1 Tax=Podospora didyma TaxID=330526 RepID=A0AAE0U7N2_9PEZI|nr:hypothetical protein B0H63DRAFT_517190 [Podospora didyma]
MPATVMSQWAQRRRRVFQSVFQTDVSQPTPHATPCIRFPEQGQPFGGLAAPPYDGPRHGTVTASAVFSQAAAAATQELLQGHHTHHHGHALLDPQDPSPTAHSPTLSTSSLSTIPAPSQLAQPFFPSLATAADDQVAFDRAWHVVTARIALPASATADDSFGTLAPDSQFLPHQNLSSDGEFYEALALVVQARTVLPRAAHIEDIVAWHAQQVRAHFAQHVVPLLSGCLDGEGEDSGLDSVESKGTRRKGGRKSHNYERHMVIVMSSIRTLEAALRLYFYGLGLLMRGFARLAESSVSDKASVDANLVAARFRRDIHALVGNSASQQLMRSVSIVLVRLTGTILGIPSEDDNSTEMARPCPPTDDDLRALAARQRLHELVDQLYNVGLGGERFQVLFAEIMDSMMSKFVTGAYAGVWTASNTRGFSTVTNTISRATNISSTSTCILSLGDWVENHFARLSFEVLSRISPDSPSPVTLSDVKTYQSLALGRLAALRISELFDIVMAWPSSCGAIDDLRATITTTARRLQLTGNFSRALQTRLLHPGCSTLEILRTYIAIIRTLHALDHSKVLLGHVESSLQLYLCQRDDAVRVVVTGLLAGPDELRAAKKVNESTKRPREKGGKCGEVEAPNRRDVEPFRTPGTLSRGPRRREMPQSTSRRRRDSTPEPQPVGELRVGASSTKLVEFALLLNDPSQSRRTAPDDDGDLDWNDMTWVPDPVDAGANYKRPKSEDVIGTLISALGSQDAFIKEFASVLADRLLVDPTRFDQELRVLDLLKRRFGDAQLQNCDVMIKDVQDSRRVDAAIHRTRQRQDKQPTTPATIEKPGKAAADAAGEGEMQLHARILSRLFWPNLEREHFILPSTIVEEQKQYEHGYESLKTGRKLTWLNQLGQARVELELRDRSVTVDCTTAEATVIYAFQDPDAKDDAPPARRSVDDLYNQLQLDEDIIAAALTFWTSKGVLRRLQSGDEYAVAETLSQPTRDATAQDEAESIVQEDERDSPRKPISAAANAKEQERRAMYWQYIRGMLTNSSASMPLFQMAMMLKMLMTDGFPWSNEELQEFLGEKVAAGELEVQGGKYKLIKNRKVRKDQWLAVHVIYGDKVLANNK